MSTRTKRPAETITVSFDFNSFLRRVNKPYAEYTPLVQSGLSLLSTTVQGAIVTMTLYGGTADVTYAFGVRAETEDLQTETQTRAVYVLAVNAPEEIGGIGGETTYLTDSGGDLLVTADGEALSVGG